MKSILFVIVLGLKLYNMSAFAQDEGDEQV